MLTSGDIRQIAGFLEGDGCFAWHKSVTGGTPVVTATQAQRWIVERLQQQLGGNLREQSVSAPSRRNRKRNGPYHEWRCSGPTAIGLMMTVYPFMSPWRQEQIRKVYARWRAVRVAFRYRTHCKQGHPYDGTNTRRYINYNGNPARECRACRREVYSPREEAKRRRARLVRRTAIAMLSA